MEGWGGERKENNWSTSPPEHWLCISIKPSAFACVRHECVCCLHPCNFITVCLCEHRPMCFLLYCPYLHAVCVCLGLDVLMQSHLHPCDNSPGPSTHQSCIAIQKKKKLITSFTSALGAHKKAYLYWSPLPEIVFQREDIILYPSKIKGLSGLQRVHQYQSNTGAGGHIQESSGKK